MKVNRGKFTRPYTARHKITTSHKITTHTQTGTAIDPPNYYRPS